MSISDAENALVANAIREKFAEIDLPHLEVHPEPVASIDYMPRIDGKRILFRNRIPEVTVFWVIDKVPSAVEEIQDLSKWFADVSPRLPVAQISLSTDSITNPGYDKQEGVEMPIQSSIHSNNPFPLEYHIIESDEGEGLERNLEIPDGLEVIVVEDFTTEWLNSTFAEKLVEDISPVSADELVDFFAISYYVDAWEDAVFHFNEVLRAYNQDQIGFLIVLLSVYFESHVESELTGFFEQIRQNEHAGNFVSDMSFEEMLTACRYFELLDESDYNVINKVRISRNDYAHEVGAFRNTEETILEQEDLVDDAIEIYERYVGLERSMLDG